MYGYVKKWAQELPEGALFDLDDLQSVFPDKSRDALKMAVFRESNKCDPIIADIWRGTYCRRQTGTPVPTSIPPIARRALLWRLAGQGAGISGPYVINQFGWSTQVCPRPWVAVVGRPPQYPKNRAIFLGRSNIKRVSLRRREASLLEAVRYFDDYAEISWDEALYQVADEIQNGYRDGNIRTSLFSDAAKAERGLGPDFLPRCKEISSVFEASQELV